MIDQASPQDPAQPSSADALQPSAAFSLYQQRIAYSAKVFQVTLRFAGSILLIVQIVKAIISAIEGENFLRLSILSASAVAVVAIAVSMPPFLNNAIAAFAARLRQERFKLFLYTFALVLTVVILVTKILVGPTSDQWRYMSSEGSIAEYGTAIAYLLMPVFTYPMLKQFRRQGNRLMSSFYWLLTAATFFVGMEELSWGQKLLGYEEPEFWSRHNAQSEITIHNLNFIQEHLLHRSFLLAGFVGSFCWIALRYWRKRQRLSAEQGDARATTRRLDLSYILPDWPLSSFFYPIFIFYLVIDTELRYRYDFLSTADQEQWELVMSLGVLLFIVINFFRQARDRDLLTID